MLANNALGCHAPSFYADHSESFRDGRADKLFIPEETPQILLVDDDPIFNKVMQRTASTAGIRIESCSRVEDVGVANPAAYQVHIIDFDLGFVNGFELARYMENYAVVEIPVIVISHSNLPRNLFWPDSIREFVHKRLGPFAILDAALEASAVMQIHQTMATNKKKKGVFR